MLAALVQAGVALAILIGTVVGSDAQEGKASDSAHEFFAAGAFGRADDLRINRVSPASDMIVGLLKHVPIGSSSPHPKLRLPSYDLVDLLPCDPNRNAQSHAVGADKALNGWLCTGGERREAVRPRVLPDRNSRGRIHESQGLGGGAPGVFPDGCQKAAVIIARRLKSGLKDERSLHSSIGSVRVLQLVLEDQVSQSGKKSGGENERDHHPFAKLLSAVAGLVGVVGALYLLYKAVDRWSVAGVLLCFPLFTGSALVLLSVAGIALPQHVAIRSTH